MDDPKEKVKNLAPIRGFWHLCDKNDVLEIFEGFEAELLETLKSMIKELSPFTHAVNFEEIKDCSKAFDELKTICEEAAGIIEDSPNCDSCDDRMGEPIPWSDLD